MRAAVTASNLLLSALALLFLAAVAGLLWLMPAGSARARGTLLRLKSPAAPITSIPNSGHSYSIGEVTIIAVSFNEAVAVTGKPKLRFFIGERKRWAHYSTTDGATLTLAYTVKGSDRDDDGLSLPRNAVRLSES